MIHRQQGQFVAVLLRQLFQGADRLLAVGRVVVDQRQLLAGKVPALLVVDVLDDDRGSIPVGARVVEDPRKHLAVGGGGAPVAHRVHRDVVGSYLGNQLVGDAGGQGLVDQGAFALGRLVAFHALLGVVAGFALDHAQRFAADAAVTLVQQREVVGIAVGEGNAVGRIGSGPVAERGKDQFRRGGTGAQRHRCRDGRGRQSLVFHIASSRVSGKPKCLGHRGWPVVVARDRSRVAAISCEPGGRAMPQADRARQGMPVATVARSRFGPDLVWKRP